MKISINELTNNFLSCEINGLKFYYLNFIRRTLLNKTCGYGIDNINILYNTSLIPKEILKKRLELFPINSEIKGYISYTKINDTEENIAVKSKDINKDIFHNNLTLTILRPKEKLSLKFSSKKDNGDNHSRFRPINFVFFKKSKKITNSYKLSEEFKNKFKVKEDGTVYDISSIMDLNNEECKIVNKGNDIYYFYCESNYPRNIPKLIINEINEKNNNYSNNLLKIINNTVFDTNMNIEINSDLIPTEYIQCVCQILRDKFNFINYYKKFNESNNYYLKIHGINNHNELINLINYALQEINLKFSNFTKQLKKLDSH